MYSTSVPNELLVLIRRWEGLRLNAYLCPAGVWTIGYGHTRGVKKGDVWTLEQAEEALLADAAEHLEATLALCPVLRNASPARQAAIADFTFNLGEGRLKASSLRRRLNDQEYGLVPHELRKWVWGGGRKLPGLIARREAEIALWESDVTDGLATG